MFEYLYEWIRNIAFYMILVMVVVQVLPNTEYKKYIRFFTGLVMILLMTTPILKLFSMDGSLSQVYQNQTYHEEIRKLEEATTYLEGIDAQQYLDSVGAINEGEPSPLEVEDIQIGE